MLTMEVENFPGFVDGILGPDLMSSMKKQAEKSGAEIIQESAISVDFKSKPLKVTVSNKVFQSKTVIIATGASAKWLGLESETRLRGKGVSACATCDAPFFKDKEVVVVGGGETAIEEALFLSKIVKKVTIIHRRDKLRACQHMQDCIFNNPKVSFIWDSIVTEIIGEDRVKGIKLKNLVTDKNSIFPCDAVFLAIGYKPNTSLFKDQIEMDNNGYIISRNETHTNLSGVFVAGDVSDNRYRQAIVAAGSGCKAAIDVEKFLIKY